MKRIRISQKRTKLCFLFFVLAERGFDPLELDRTYAPSLCLPNEIDKWKYIYRIYHVMRTRYISIFLREKL